MRISYRQDDMSLDKRGLFLADLIGYKLQRDLKASQKMRALADDKNYLTKIVNVARRSKSTTGMTVDSVLLGIETALSMDIFCFKINGVDPFKLVNEQIKNKEFLVEVYMNPLYFASEIALTQVIPGFRKKEMDEKYIQERMERAGKSWSFSFEKGIKDYIDLSKCEKKILEA
jgi:hypothetical protein